MLNIIKKHWPVIIIFFLAFFIRLRYLPEGALTFGYDQARDAFLVQEILSGNLKIQGPPTSTQDFFHGVLYYYVIAPGYALGHGSPIVAAQWLAFVTSFGAVLIYLMFYLMLRDRLVATLFGLLFATAYEQTQYAGYLSNTSLATLTIPVLYTGLWGWITGKKWGPLVSGLGLGASVQANFFLLYHIPVVVFLGLIKKIPLGKRNLISFILFFVLAISSMLVSEIKFGFPSRNGPNSLFSRSDYKSLKISYLKPIGTYISQMKRLFGLNLFPQQPKLILIIGLILAVNLVTIPPRPIWWPLVPAGLLAPAPALIFGGISSPYIIVGLSTIVFLIFGYCFTRLPQRLRWLVPAIVTVFILANLAHIHKINPSGQVEFSIQRNMNLKNELAVIDNVYTEAGKKPFSLNTITAPLYINTTWSYLFNWYGMSKYRYLPYWHGHDQIGSLGNNLSRPPSGVSQYFLIIEPPPAIPQDMIDSRIAEENGYSTFNGQKLFAEIVVHNRTAIQKK